MYVDDSVSRRLQQRAVYFRRVVLGCLLFVTSKHSIPRAITLRFSPFLPLLDKSNNNGTYLR